MLRSMYSGISGLKNFQTKLDVIGNNIANVNTYGFKKGRTVFKDLVSQTTAGASAASDNRGGVNARQIGLGSQIATIDTLHSQGSSQFTGNTLDLAITGDGFFKVEDGGEIAYNRAGNFYMDQQGDLLDGDGRYLQGLPARPGQAVDGEGNDYTGDGAATGGEMRLPTGVIAPADIGRINIPITASSMSIGSDGTVFFVDLTEYGRTQIKDAQDALDSLDEAAREGSTEERNLADAKAEHKAVLQVAGKIQITKFSNPGGLEKTGGNLYRASANSGIPEDGFALDQGFGTIESGFLEMSNVDLSEEFTEMIVAQRGFQANTRIITTSDEILQELVNLKR